MKPFLTLAMLLCCSVAGAQQFIPGPDGPWKTWNGPAPINDDPGLRQCAVFGGLFRPACQGGSCPSGACQSGSCPSGCPNGQCQPSSRQVSEPEMPSGGGNPAVARICSPDRDGAT